MVRARMRSSTGRAKAVRPDALSSHPLAPEAELTLLYVRVSKRQRVLAAVRRGGNSITMLLRRSKPTVAAINGYAAGVGLTLVLPCDVRIAADDARLSIRFVKMGLMPELGSTRLLAQIVGLGNATEMCLTGRFVEAEEALRMGLVTAVAPRDSLMDVAVAKAGEIANNPTTAVMMIKELLAKNPTDPDLDAVMEREQTRDEIARRLPDHREAVSAFREKREARFNQ